MLKKNKNCFAFCEGARLVGIDGNERRRLCLACKVGGVWGVRLKCSPDNCAIFCAIVGKNKAQGVKEKQKRPRPCDFLSAECRQYIKSFGGWLLVKKYCIGCALRSPCEGCAFWQARNGAGR